MESFREQLVDGRLKFDIIGLDYVFLDGGFTFHDTAYGEGVSIAGQNGLQSAVVRAILSSPMRIRGTELRFLRTEMDLAAGACAKMIGCAPYQLIEWEACADLPIPSSFDRKIRAAASGRLGIEPIDVEPERRSGERSLVAKYDPANDAWAAELTSAA